MKEMHSQASDSKSVKVQRWETLTGDRGKYHMSLEAAVPFSTATTQARKTKTLA
jgi:hypothetical protein